MDTPAAASVLLVGADAYTLVEAKETLESPVYGVAADMETCTAEALHRVDGGLDCLVVADVEGGEELVREMRLRGWTSLPVIFYTTGESAPSVASSDFVHRHGPHGGPVVLAERVRLVVERKRMLEAFERVRREYAEGEQLATAARMSSLIGHDIRSPLQAINIALAILRRNPGKAEEAVKIIEDSVKKSAEILDDFRAETRITPLKVAPINLEHLIEASIPPNLAERKIAARTTYEGDLAGIPVDAASMQRVIESLIRNAMEAMPEGGTLTLSAIRDRDGARIRVSDTGKGIPADVRRELFRPFQTTKPKGVGLALAHCKRIVHEHGGSITVDSEEGRGATFTIRLPCEGAAPEEPRAPTLSRREENPGT